MFLVRCDAFLIDGCVGSVERYQWYLPCVTFALLTASIQEMDEIICCYIPELQLRGETKGTASREDVNQPLVPT